MLEIVCEMPQGSILETLLFLFYINHLPQASELLAATLFADDTNLFYLMSSQILVNGPTETSYL